MLNQFHDVLPGTSIKMVNDDVHEIYDRRIAQTTQLLEAAITQLLPKSHTMNGAVEGQQEVMILDPLRAPRTQVVTLNSSVAGLVASAQKLHDGSAVALVQSDNHGSGKVIGHSQTTAPSAEQQGDIHILRNADISLVISDGRITSLRDERLQRELILPGPGAETAGLMIYEDLPLAYDAWDAEIYHLDQVTPLLFESVEITASGPLRASLKATTTFGSSTITLVVSLIFRFVWHSG
jgi:alpha-mannosidase